MNKKKKRKGRPKKKKCRKKICLDKGYDNKKIHEFIREVIEVLSIIPARNEDVPIHRTSSKYRKQMKKGYSREYYFIRNKSETVNSVVKRKFGDSTLAMTWRNQNKEILFRLIFYAAHRYISIFLLFFSRKIIPPLTKEEKSNVSRGRVSGKPQESSLTLTNS